MTRSARPRSFVPSLLAAGLGLALVPLAPAAGATSPTGATAAGSAGVRAVPTAYDLRLVGPAEATTSWSENLNDRGVVAGGSSNGGWTATRRGAARPLATTAADGASYGVPGRPTSAKAVNDAGMVLGAGATPDPLYQYGDNLLLWPSASGVPSKVAGPYVNQFQWVSPVALNATGTALYRTSQRGLGTTSWTLRPGGTPASVPQSTNEGFVATDLDDYGTVIATSRPYYHGLPFVPGARAAVELRYGATDATVLPSLPRAPESPQADGASAISPDGRYVVGWSGTTPVVWDHRRRVSALAGVPQGFWAVDVNRQGVVLGFVGREPWLWSKGTATPVAGLVRGMPDGTTLCLPKAINKSADIALSLCQDGTTTPTRAAVLTPVRTS